MSELWRRTVGVVLNLAIWFALFTLFDRVDEHCRFGARLYEPDPSTLNWAAAVIAAGAGIAIFRYRRPTLQVVAVAARSAGSRS